VEQELIEFKIEIDDKVAENDTRHYVFPRGEQVRMNTESNKMDISHSYS
jgi:hypothetical protein